MRNKLCCALLLAWPALFEARAQAPAPIKAGASIGTNIGTNHGSLRAQLVAVRQAVIASELAGKISKLPVREGQSFRQGDVLVSYDCALNRARLERASQAESAARKKRDVAEQLDQLGSISHGDLEQARAAVSVAQAESGIEKVMVRRCAVTAPFSGRVGETFVRAAEHVAEGKELLSIYDDSAFEVQTIVSSKNLAWLKPGATMRVTVDETGQTYDATVIRVAGTVDPVSQTVKVTGRIDNGKDSRARSAALLPGMGGSVQLQVPAATAARAP